MLWCAVRSMWHVKLALPRPRAILGTALENKWRGQHGYQLKVQLASLRWGHPSSGDFQKQYVFFFFEKVVGLYMYFVRFVCRACWGLEALEPNWIPDWPNGTSTTWKRYIQFVYIFLRVLITLASFLPPIFTGRHNGGALTTPNALTQERWGGSA